MNTRIREAYVKGREYVVCPHCKSHILLMREYLDPLWEGEERRPVTVEFSCDWEPCGEQFDAVVKPPRVRRADAGT